MLFVWRPVSSWALWSGPPPKWADLFDYCA